MISKVPAATAETETRYWASVSHLDRACESVTRIAGSHHDKGRLPDELRRWLHGEKSATEVEWARVHGWEGDN